MTSLSSSINGSSADSVEEHIVRKNEGCHRHCMTGPEWHMPIITFFLIALPCALFNSTLLPWFFQRVSFFLAAVLCGIAAILQMSTLAFFLGTVCSNPGIIPRGRNPLEAYDVTTDKFRESGPPKYQVMLIRGHLFRLKYCDICYIYRTPRAVHCFVCGNCVERFDHHCPWVGNCVGRRNYRWFYGFLSSISLLILFVLATSLTKLGLTIWDPTSNHSISAVFGDLWPRLWDAVLLAVLTFVTVWFLLGLWGYHSYLTYTNQTTYEQLKRYYETDYNPFNKGAAGNVWEILCTPARPRVVDSSTESRLFEPRDAKLNPSVGSPSAPWAAGHSKENCGYQSNSQHAAATNTTKATMCRIEICSLPLHAPGGPSEEQQAPVLQETVAEPADQKSGT